MKDDLRERLNQIARSELFCGRCRSSTFLIWQDEVNRPGYRHVPQGSVTLELTDTHRLPYEEPDGESVSCDELADPEVDDWNYEPPKTYTVSVIVRCAFFRMNVAYPRHLVHCEGFKPCKEK